MFDNYWTKRTILLIIAYLLYLFSWHTAFAEEATIIVLKDYLSKEELQSAMETVAGAPAKPLALVINSSSGDLIQTLEFSKKIYEWKMEKQLPVVVYIEDNAIGPAAMLPFLADEIYTSLFISWGDIPFGNEKVLSTNILRNRVISLINPQNPQAAKLHLIAAAMSDSSIHLIDSNGWRPVREEGDAFLSAVSPKGETLVINHNQLKELGLGKGVVSLEQFYASYSPAKTQEKTESIFPPLEGQAVPRRLLEEELKKHIIFSPQGPNKIGYIIIEDHSTSITQATWLYVKKALDYYKENKPIFIILELNTPGGEVFAAQKISDALKEFDTQFGIPVVAYINNWAISAGAMLAYSCRFIVAARDASMGAAEPIIVGLEGQAETASEKVNSALRADFASRARFFNRDPLIAEAMVDKDMLLVIRHGRVVKLDSDAQIRADGPYPDIVLSPKGKLLTLNAEQLMTFGVADLTVQPTRTASITGEEREIGKWPAEKVALFHQPFFDAIPNATIDAFQMDWKMKFFAMLASPMVSSLLMLGLMIGFYLEISTPGFGVPGTIAATCLFLIILSSFSLEIAGWLELILLLVGIGVIAVELFFLPTFGLLGIIGLIFFLIGLFGMLLPGAGSVEFEFDTQTFNAAGEVFMERLAWLSGTLVVGVIFIALIARYLTPRLAAFSRLVLKGSEQQGYISVENLAGLPKPGAEGEAATTLRPAGKVIVQDVLYDAVSGGPLIEKGETVIVTGLDSGTLVVKPINHRDEEEKPS